jgi:hypothetical protein
MWTTGRDTYEENRFIFASIGYRIRVCAVQKFPLIGLLPAMLGSNGRDSTPLSPPQIQPPPPYDHPSLGQNDGVATCRIYTENCPSHSGAKRVSFICFQILFTPFYVL